MKDVLTVLGTLVAMWFGAIVYTLAVVFCPWIPLGAAKHEREQKELFHAALEKAIKDRAERNWE